METIKNYFFRDIGVMLGRSMLHIFRSMNAITTMAVLPIAFMLLFAYVVGGLILMVEEIFFKWKG
jgi:hypothetical protein